MHNLVDFTIRFALFALAHSVLAGDRLKERVHAAMGPAFRWYRLVYNLLSLILFAWVMAAWPRPPLIYRLPGGWHHLFHGMQLALFCVLCRCAMRLDLGEFLGFSQLRGKRRVPVLVRTGCYGQVRHPQYMLVILILLINPEVTVKWCSLTVLSTIYFVVGAVIEERRLAKFFGATYARYQEVVPMFVPRFRGQSPSSGNDRPVNRGAPS